MTAVLAIDLGSTGVKVAVVDGTGRVLAASGERLALIFTPDGGVEQDPDGWWEAIGRCSRRAVAEAAAWSATLGPGDITIVAVTSQYSSTVPVATDGTPVGNAIMWMDQRGHRHHPCLPAGRDEMAWWIERHGMVPHGNDDIGHIAWIRHHLPDVYAAAAAFVEPMDALAAHLTGAVTATQSTVFAMMACDNRVWGSTAYDDGMIERARYDAAKLPPLVPLGAPRGAITAAAAEHLGVSPQAIVTGATIDSVTSAVGTGAIDDRRVGLIIGTTTVMATHLPDKREDLEHGLMAAPSPLPGRYFLVAENGVGGKALDVLVTQIAPGDDFDTLLDAAAAVEPGANGVMAFPWLMGSMAPAFDRHMRGAYTGIGVATTKADITRAVVEGIGLNATRLLPPFGELAGHAYERIAIGGGTASSPLVGQVLADCLGVPVDRLARPQTTNAHGAALLALAETGAIAYSDLPALLTIEHTHEPNPTTADLYRHRLDLFTRFHEATAAFHADLAADPSASIAR